MKNLTFEFGRDWIKTSQTKQDCREFCVRNGYVVSFLNLVGVLLTKGHACFQTEEFFWEENIAITEIKYFTRNISVVATSMFVAIKDTHTHTHVKSFLIFQKCYLTKEHRNTNNICSWHSFILRLGWKTYCKH